MAAVGELEMKIDCDLRTLPNNGRFVLEIDELLKPEQCRRLQDDWAKFWEDAPSRPKLLLLQRGMKLRTITEQEDIRG